MLIRLTVGIYKQFFLEENDKEDRTLSPGKITYNVQFCQKVFIINYGVLKKFFPSFEESGDLEHYEFYVNYLKWKGSE